MVLMLQQTCCKTSLNCLLWEIHGTPRQKAKESLLTSGVDWPKKAGILDLTQNVSSQKV